MKTKFKIQNTNRTEFINRKVKVFSHNKESNIKDLITYKNSNQRRKYSFNIEKIMTTKRHRHSATNSNAGESLLYNSTEQKTEL